MSAARTLHCLLALALGLGLCAQEQRVVSGIVVEGNKRTRERIILRELVFHEGDTLTTDALYEQLERSRQNLMNTALFNSVVLLPTYLPGSDVFITITVNERWYLWPSPIIQLADPNFNTWWLTKDFSRINYGAYLYQYNFRGLNETIYLKMQFGYARQFGLRYKVPYFDKRQRWGFSIGGQFAEQREITIGTVDNKRVLFSQPDLNARTEWKGDVQMTLRPTHDLRHSWTLGYVQAGVQDTIGVLAPDYFGQGALDTRYLVLGYGLVHDERDSRAYTRDGHYAELRLWRFGLGLGDLNAPDLTTAYATIKHWQKLSERWTVSLTGRGKTTWGNPVPYYVQEGLGYENFIRGYEYYVIDGQHYVLGKADAAFALIKPRQYTVDQVPIESFRTLYVALYLDVYVDLGHVWDDQYDDVNFLAGSWQSGYGAGLDLVTSYDQVLRIEYSFNALGEGGLFLHFTQPF
jgi:outer membrane protein assembly factor BamA